MMAALVGASSCCRVKECRQAEGQGKATMASRWLRILLPSRFEGT